MAKPLTYFVSDIHLGLQVGDPAAREKAFLLFLRSISPAQTDAMYLLGDVFDFWYEYRDLVPKGSTRVLAALADLVDEGVKVFFFRGNHDLWVKDYFGTLGIQVLEQPYTVRIGRQTFCLGHGDALGPGDHKYKFFKWLFSRRWAQTLYTSLHPWLAFRIATGWSSKSRGEKPIAYTFKGEDERLYKYSLDFQKHSPVDHFIFGHYHCRVDMPVGNARLHVLGDWMTSPNWLAFDAASGKLEEHTKL